MGLKCPKCGSTKSFSTRMDVVGTVRITLDGNEKILEEFDYDVDYCDDGPYRCDECDARFQKDGKLLGEDD